jgi:4-diphosphocytidyl-2C-methyl-D-erythritol kinase
VSTKKVFEAYKKLEDNSIFPNILEIYRNKEKEVFINKLKNDLTETTLNLYPQLKKEIKKLKYKAHMTGSGSTFFLIVSDENEEKIIKRMLKKRLNYMKIKPKS